MLLVALSPPLMSSFAVGVEVPMPIDPADSTITESAWIVEPVHFGIVPGVPLPVTPLPVGAGFAVMVASSLPVRALSETVNRTTYTPLALNVAVVLSALGLLNVTVPGPLTLLHVLV